MDAARKLLFGGHELYSDTMKIYPDPDLHQLESSTHIDIDLNEKVLELKVWRHFIHYVSIIAEIVVGRGVEFNLRISIGYNYGLSDLVTIKDVILTIYMRQIFHNF